MWIAVGAFHRTALIARLLGMTMIALGAGVLAIAVGRLSVGSHPEPMSIAGFGIIALAAQIASGALALRNRGERLSLGAVWRVSRDACAAHLTVIAAAAVAAFLKTNLGDIVVGAAIAAMFAVNGLVMLVNGRLPAPAES
jgi:Co/Zn/Cd efflux system component